MNTNTFMNLTKCFNRDGIVFSDLLHSNQSYFTHICHIYFLIYIVEWEFFKTTF